MVMGKGFSIQEQLERTPSWGKKNTEVMVLIDPYLSGIRFCQNDDWCHFPSRCPQKLGHDFEKLGSEMKEKWSLLLRQGGTQGQPEPEPQCEKVPV